jgi:tetratricopeptide (TPR) repeat protein
VLIVWGLGGAGKSQLVLNYIQEYRHDYSAVFWMEAGQKETLERDYIQIYRLLIDGCLAAGPETVQIADAVAAVKNWFHCHSGRWLFVLDSADSIDNRNDPSYIDLGFFIPDICGVHVIITTRSSMARDMTNLEAVEVGEMALEEAAELFRKSAKLSHIDQDIEKEVISIIEELGYLALATTLAGSYVAATPRLSYDIRQYLNEYRTQRKRLLSHKPTRYIHQYGESVLSTWETSFHAITAQSLVASRLLSLLAFLNFDNIWLGLFNRSRVGPDPPLQAKTSTGQTWQSLISPDAPLDLYTLESAFAVLQTYSLVQWKLDQNSYSMHKLVHAWGCNRLDMAEQNRLSFGALQLLVEYLSVSEIDPSSKLRLRPHLMASFGMSRRIYLSLELRDRERLDLIKEIGNFLYETGQWSDVFDIHDFHFKNMSEILGEKNLLVLASMNNLALVLSKQGKYKEAETMHRQELELSEKVLGKEHPDTLTSMNNLAGVLRDRGKYKEAEAMHRQTLGLRERVLGKEHPDALTSMNNLAFVLGNQGKYEEAEAMHRQTLGLRERVLGKEHPDALTSMNNLASVLSDQGKYEEAEAMHRQTLGLRERVLGKEHPDTLTSMNNLAEVLRNQDKYEEAEAMHRQTLGLSERVLGKEHPNTLKSMNNLAEVLRNQDKCEEAEAMHRQTLGLREKMFGKEHPNTLTSMSNLALVLSDQGKHEEAEAMYWQTLGLRERVLGKEHPSTLTSMSNLALVLSAQGKYKEAEAMHRQTLRLSEKVLGKEHPGTLTSMNDLALVLGNQGKYEEAEAMHRQELGLSEKVLGREYSGTLTSMNNLAWVLSDQGKYEEAEAMHRQTLGLREKMFGKEHPDTLTSMNNLAKVLSKQGKYEAEAIHR